MQPFAPKRPVVFVFVDYLHHASEVLNVTSFEVSVLALSLSRSLPCQMMFPVRERVMVLSNVPCPCSFCSVRKRIRLLLFLITTVDHEVDSRGRWCVLRDRLSVGDDIRKVFLVSDTCQCQSRGIIFDVFLVFRQESDPEFDSC